MSRLAVGKIYKVDGKYPFYFLYQGCINTALDIPVKYVSLLVLNINDKITVILTGIRYIGLVSKLPQLGFGDKPYECLMRWQIFNKYHSNHIFVSTKERTKLMLKGLI